METKPFYDARTFTVTYVVHDPASHDAVIIDPVLDYDPAASKVWRESVDLVLEYAREMELNVHYILETHAHADHLSGSQLLKKTYPQAKVAIGERIKVVQETFKGVFALGDEFSTDGSQFDVLLKDGDTVRAGNLTFDVIFTAGPYPRLCLLQVRRADGKDVISLRIELPILWIVVLNVAGWPVIQFGLAWAITRMPVTWFNPGGAHAWEQGGRFYERMFGIKRWKDWLPDAARWFGGGFAKGTLVGTKADYLHRFIRETWRGELCHWCALGCAPLFFLWNPWWADLVMVTYALVANLPCILAQRYNRLRFQRLRARRC